MTSTHKLSAAVLSAFLALGTAGCATDRGVRDVASDTVITTKVKAALIGDPDVAGTRINVETLNGTVQLSGFAKSAQEAQRAMDLARRVDGVKNVINKTSVAPR